MEDTKWMQTIADMITVLKATNITTLHDPVFQMIICNTVLKALGIAQVASIDASSSAIVFSAAPTC
jgi:hypothetical protein